MRLWEFGLLLWIAECDCGCEMRLLREMLLWREMFFCVNPRAAAKLQTSHYRGAVIPASEPDLRGFGAKSLVQTDQTGQTAELVRISVVL